MTSTVRRAVAFALVGSVALVVPLVADVESPALAAVAAIAPFVAIAAVALAVIDEGVLFELFARPGDRRDRTLYGLASFSLAIAGLALLAVQFGMPVWVFVGSVFVLAYGNVAGHAVRAVASERFLATAGFVTGGFLAGIVGQILAGRMADVTVPLALAAFLAASGALLAALLRSILFERDDPLVLLSIGLLLWLFTDLPLSVTTTRVAVAIGVTAVLGYVSYALDTASLPGMLTGVFLGLLTIVLGDFRWFALLVTFFGLGGLSTKYRYEEKLRRGVAEENQGARGSGNVLANSVVALGAVLAAAASPSHTATEPVIFLFAFAGAVAAALSDTFSSEFGGLFDHPRLITTLEPVEPGTDGGVTWQGEVAGIAGATVIAAIAFASFGRVDTLGATVVVVAGVAGMTVDSLLGATVEQRFVGNQGVNLLATLAAACLAAGLSVVVGLV